MPHGGTCLTCRHCAHLTPGISAMHTRPSRPRWLTVSLIVITLVASINLRDIAAWAGWTVPGLPMPFGGAVVDNGLGVLLALAVAAWLLRPGHALPDLSDADQARLGAGLHGVLRQPEQGRAGSGVGHDL